MELKTKSISQMDNKELQKLNERLRDETRVTDLILSIKRYNGEKWSFDEPPRIPTKVSIGQLIKTSSDYENETIGGMDSEKLKSFIIRLESEERALQLLNSLKNSSEGLDPYPNPNEAQPVYSDTPVEDIYHHGIKGQKWNKRRYQNEDGTWTAAGRIRYGKKDQNINTASLSNIVKRQKLETEYNKLNPTAQQRREKEIQTINNETDKILRESLNIGSGPKSKVITKDYSDLTNDELKKRIERLNLESNYGRLTGDTKMVRSGGDWAREIIQSAGAIVAIGSSAAVIYSSMKKTKELAEKVVQHGDFLSHHGIKGQRWGIRRYQNEDGTLTEAGRRRLENADRDDAKYAEQKKKTKKAIIVGVAATAAAVAGTAWYLKRRDNMQIKAIEASKNIEIDSIKKQMQEKLSGAYNSGFDTGKKLGLGQNKIQNDLAKKAAKTGSSWLSNKLTIPTNIKDSPGSKSFVKDFLKEHKWL